MGKRRKKRGEQLNSEQVVPLAHLLGGWVSGRGRGGGEEVRRGGGIGGRDVGVLGGWSGCRDAGRCGQSRVNPPVRVEEHRP